MTEDANGVCVQPFQTTRSQNFLAVTKLSN